MILKTREVPFFSDFPVAIPLKMTNAVFVSLPLALGRNVCRNDSAAVLGLGEVQSCQHLTAHGGTCCSLGSPGLEGWRVSLPATVDGRKKSGMDSPVDMVVEIPVLIGFHTSKVVSQISVVVIIIIIIIISIIIIIIIIVMFFYHQH